MPDDDASGLRLEIPLDKIRIVRTNRNGPRIAADRRPGDELNGGTVAEIEETGRQMLGKSSSEPECPDGLHPVATFRDHGGDRLEIFRPVRVVEAALGNFESVDRLHVFLARGRRLDRDVEFE